MRTYEITQEMLQGTAAVEVRRKPSGRRIGLVRGPARIVSDVELTLRSTTPPQAQPPGPPDELGKIPARLLVAAIGELAGVTRQQILEKAKQLAAAERTRAEPL